MTAWSFDWMLLGSVLSCLTFVFLIGYIVGRAVRRRKAGDYSDADIEWLRKYERHERDTRDEGEGR